MVVQGQEFTEQYRLEFQRVPRGPWFHYRNRRGQEVSHLPADHRHAVRFRYSLFWRRVWRKLWQLGV